MKNTMKPILAFAFSLILSASVFAQTPIDGLQKQNLNFLESQENEGYEFRSQIITEFDAAHASQNVNIKLSKGFNYIIVAIGDSNIPAIDLSIKPAKGAALESIDIGSDLAGQAYNVAPNKSGQFKISINAQYL